MSLADRILANTGQNGVGHEDDFGPSSWAQVDLTDALAGKDLPAPELLCRTDGHHLLYRGRVHWFQGESESCKSWLALLAAAQTLDAGGRVLWIDFEDDDRGVVSRLKALGVPDDTIRDRFDYRRPQEPVNCAQAEAEIASLLAHEYDLAVIDGVTEAFTVEGLSMLDNGDIAKWLRLLPKRIAAQTGAAVVCIDHLPKDRDNHGRFAIGGQHKLAGLTGSAYRLEVRRRFRRTDNTDPREGLISITVVKDRPGWVRAHAGENDAIAEFTLTSYPDGGVSAVLTAPDIAPAPDLALCRRILEHLAIYDGASKNRLERDVTGNDHAIREAIKWMVDEPRQWVRVETSGRSHLHYLTGTGRSEFDL
jgi:hypothetical protein